MHNSGSQVRLVSGPRSGPSRRLWACPQQRFGRRRCLVARRLGRVRRMPPARRTKQGFWRKHLCLRKAFGASICACAKSFAQACVLAQSFWCKRLCLHKAFGASMCACAKLLSQACVLAPFFCASISACIDFFGASMCGCTGVLVQACVMAPLCLGKQCACSWILY